MSINVQIYNHTARIVMSDRFDFHVHRDFKNAYAPLLDNAAVHEIEIEMSKLAYMDSAALGMLMLLYERAKSANKCVVLCNPSNVVATLFEVANFDRIFNIRNMASSNMEGRKSVYGNLMPEVVPAAT
jgi:anti-anti-sigma factor